MTFKNVDTARLFIDSLGPNVKEIATLNVRVGLSADDFENQELMLVGLAQIMRTMKIFRDYCQLKQTQLGQKIVWQWQKYGFLESLAEMGPLNDLVDAKNKKLGWIDLGNHILVVGIILFAIFIITNA